MAGPEGVVVCNLINTYLYTHALAILLSVVLAFLWGGFNPKF